MKKFFVAALLLSAAGTAFAANPDTLSVKEIEEIEVKGTKLSKNAPFAVSKISKGELAEFSTSGQEMPFLFARTPGIVAWSENGLGTGTTYMSIRGAQGSRINVTLDGVSLNSPEDQTVFWANMNSFASFLGGVQIQRGVGASSNGDGAFGGSIALMTKSPSYDPEVEITAAGGTYGTFRLGGQFSTGLTGIKLNKGYLVLDGAYHHTSTDGYMHGTEGSSGSYYGALTYINSKGNFKVSYKHIGNYETTGQAWNGATTGDNDNSLLEGSNITWDDNYYYITGINHTGIRTYADLYKVGLGKFNSLYESLDNNYGKYNNFADDEGRYTTSRYMMNDGTYWARTTDNFWQNHHLLNFSWKINERWNTSATLHYTRGHGYYDEFRPDNKLSKFGLPWETKKMKSDFVRQKGLTQNTYGIVWNANYTSNKWDVNMGVAAQNFQGNHYGYLTYISNEDVAARYMANGKYKYYNSDASKNDENIYLKGTYHITKSWDVYADLQYRHVGFFTDGINDRFVTYDKGLNIEKQPLNINKHYHFFNPKAGISYHKNGHNLFASYAMSNREPERNNFTDNGKFNENTGEWYIQSPRAERVHDVELGYGYTGSNWYINMNLYYMGYTDQFIKTGELSDIGEALTTNIKDSYRMGIEASIGYSPTRWLTLEANGAFSRNRLKNFDEVVSLDWEEDFETVHYDNTTIAFSPSVLLNGFADFHYKGFKAVWHTNFVSKQYLDNTENDLRSLPRYSTTNIHLSYDWKIKNSWLKDVIFGMDFNNIFNRHYATNAWVYSSKLTKDYYGYDVDRYTQIGFIPAADFNFMGHFTLKF